ncbi:B12-binding domain-containing radical SAM protein [Geomonas sp. Red32]|uniref:B12-binding domain-containing radical SAM protein n=1 Tax=Geomonas sp. Red32 TaxID=2912856 RepID=UPI00202CB8A4|nr:radical SAM protein [Geomonas sp. Red32]MCM0083135.1 B12-binding domain-containing radical SAM protein [Geomonas sp. Red32]
MKVLLLRPHPGNDCFGLGPFFRVEPLGLEYIGAALLAEGHEVTIADLRFRPGAATWVRRTRPRLIAISCLHALEYDQVVRLARELRQAAPEAFIVVGGHAAAAFPEPLEVPEIDAICLEDGEELVPLLARTLERGEHLQRVGGLRLRGRDGWFFSEAGGERPELDSVPLPARHLVARHRNGYHCLLFKPVWLVETARGCPHRCSFCSVWQLYGRSCRERSIEAVVEDFASSGDAVFVADDLFWYNEERSLALAEALKRRRVFKRWILVQTRTDLICKSASLMEAWRPLAKDFDIFLGLEGASDQALSGITKDSGIGESIEAVRIARELRYGINGNFVVGHDWSEENFRELWEFVERYGLQRAGFTILTPLPGTEFYRQKAPIIPDQPWGNFDMHHLLWEPYLGVDRFFELYAETWRRSILNTSGDKSLLEWIRQVRPGQIPYIARVLWRTQRMMKPQAYLKEHRRSHPVPFATTGYLEGET